ncbi:hypothetical protein AAZX31_11G217300 [Glycine max]|nr:hypothetical protein JHK85_032621 [Glycine max]KAG4995225.1 hypothetical protein JHK86_032052 [Glycine max]KAG5125218.1 hypothetical protein JHK82_031955 [Glycine max]KAG5146643.1 hypothetical protein JHK84_032186 [Glycine max]
MQHRSKMNKRPRSYDANDEANPRRSPPNTQFRSTINSTAAAANALNATLTVYKEQLISNLKQNIDKPPPIGLTLQESTIKSIEDTVNASYERKRKSAPLIPNDLRADIFPATGLRIGEYKFLATHKGTLMVGFYYATKRLAWEIFDIHGGIKYKIEVPWQNILAMRAIIEENKHGILQIKLAKAPTFFRHIDPPNPRSHPKWEPSNDFTGGHALKHQVHSLGFPPGDLDKYYRKLIQHDNRLLQLSQVSFSK